MQYICNGLILIFFSLYTLCSSAGETITIKLLGINDFHGQISAGRFNSEKPVGSAPVLAAYLRQAQKGYEDASIITMMGDQFGASPPASGLLQDEPTILFLNTLANKECSTTNRMNPRCNLVAAIGNHEFDRGLQNLFATLYGSHQAPKDEWLPHPQYEGSVFPFLAANIVDESSGKLLFPPYVIKEVQGIKIAFIGALLQKASDSILGNNIKGIQFLDETEAINHFVPEILNQGANVIVVLTHQGGNQFPYEGETKSNQSVDGDIVNMVKRLDDHIDVVMSGHTHQFTNAWLKTKSGKEILVTQARSYSMAFADVTLTIDKDSQTLIAKSAKIISTEADKWPGNTPDPLAQAIVNYAEKAVEKKTARPLGTLASNLTRKPTAAGETNIGDFIADAYRASMAADFAIINPHSIRNDLYAGVLTWGQAYSAIPFSNRLVKLSVTGAQLARLLEQQWIGGSSEILQISGFTYVWSNNKPLGQHVITLKKEGIPLAKNQLYTLVTTTYFAQGNGIFSAMKDMKPLQEGETDIEAIEAYIRGLDQPILITTDERIKSVD